MEPFLSTYETVIQPEISTIKWKKSCTVSIQQVVGILNLLHFAYKRYAENSGNFILFYLYSIESQQQLHQGALYYKLDHTIIHREKAPQII